MPQHHFLLRASEPAVAPTSTNVQAAPDVVHFHRATRPGLGAVRRARRLLGGVVAAFAIGMSLAFVVPSAAALQSAGLEREATQAFAVTAAAQPPMVRDGYGVTAPPPVQWPLPQDTRMSSDFGPRSCAGCSSDHQGIDLNAPGGTPIESIAAGVVIETDAPGWAALGEHVRIRHLIDGEPVTSVYAHMQAGTMTLAVGDEVAVGQALGLLGCTGSCTGDHLHFELRTDSGAAVDPAAWLAAHAG